ncbi:ectoine synthase [Streptomyces hyaluromycini]|uniref:L-ectoine synthase n=1 Tax=Streptomyces hyaluromycini TaxID=1377993 RepID=A0ABV1WRD9_9ACTN
MIIRSREESTTVDWGNGLSHRLLIASDGMGFAFAETLVRAGTKSALEYRNHLEACYCISGSGEVMSADGSTGAKLRPGVLYALNDHDPHYLIADPGADMRLISVFNPPIRGDERHSLTDGGFSAY